MHAQWLGEIGDCFIPYFIHHWTYDWTVIAPFTQASGCYLQTTCQYGMIIHCCLPSSAGRIFSLGGQTRRVGGWVDSIRQVDVDLNFLLVECSSVDWIYVGKFFCVGRIHWLATQCYSWVGSCPPCPLGSRAFVFTIQLLLFLQLLVMAG